MKIYQVSYDVPDKSRIIKAKKGLEQHNFVKSQVSDEIRTLLRNILEQETQDKNKQKSVFIVKEYQLLKQIKHVEENYKEILIQKYEAQKIKWKDKKHELRRQKIQQKIDWVNKHFEEVKPKIEYNEIIPLVVEA